MIEGGIGGNSTTTGLEFERSTDLATALVDAGFSVNGSHVFRQGELVGRLVGKNALYAFLAEQGVDWATRVSAKLLPDEAFYATQTRVLTVVEKKWQQVAGSVDEKLQTCGFKLRQYRRLFAGTDIEVRYQYVLNDWFSAPRYQDVLDYITEAGADFHFSVVPLTSLGLPVDDRSGAQ